MQRTFAVILDMDGTLVDSAVDILEAVNRTRVDHSLETYSMHELRPLIGRPPVEFFPELLPMQRENAAQEFRRTLAQLSGEGTPVMPGVREFLATMRSELPRVRLGVATNKPTALAQSILTAVGLADSIEVIVGSDDRPPKPDAAIPRHCLTMLCATDGVMIGDTAEDIVSGRAAGMATIGLLNGYGEPELARPDFSLPQICDAHLIVDNMVRS